MRGYQPFYGDYDDVRVGDVYATPEAARRWIDAEYPAGTYEHANWHVDEVDLIGFDTEER